MQNDECGVMNDEGHAAFNSSFIIPHSSFLKSVSADLREQFGGGALEEGFVEAAHRFGGVALLDDEGQVDGGRALRDQEDVDVLDGREDARGDAGRATESLADDADDGAVRLDLDGPDKLKVGDDGVERRSVFE